MPSKVTATELKGILGDDELHEESAALVRAARCRDFRVPDFSAAKALSAAQRGTATHTLMQYISLDKVATAQDISDEALRLVADCRLTEQEAAAIDTSAVCEFFASPLGREMLSADEIKREFRFTLLANAAKFFPDASDGDTMLLQGIIDCFFIKDGAITVVDYKTDNISKAQVAERAETYRAQLGTYADAISRITGLPVRKSVLYFLVPGEIFAI